MQLIGVEAGGRGIGLGEHAARFRGGVARRAAGAHSYLLQDEDGQVALTHSVSAGLDYALVGPEHAWLHDKDRAEYVSLDDSEALDAAQVLCAHRRHHPGARIRARRRRSHRRAPEAAGQIFIVNLSGRGDKDIDIYRENFTELDVGDA